MRSRRRLLPVGMSRERVQVYRQQAQQSKHLQVACKVIARFTEHRNPVTTLVREPVLPHSFLCCGPLLPRGPVAAGASPNVTEVHRVLRDVRGTQSDLVANLKRQAPHSHKNVWKAAPSQILNGASQAFHQVHHPLGDCLEATAEAVGIGVQTTTFLRPEQTSGITGPSISITLLGSLRRTRIVLLGARIVWFDALFLRVLAE
mmetsp:Transcript_8923/g.23360  ORF Transcript_8923/g.23360 Transcript_8923/m.23360 type:complete len:203 (-) Transcript_8923:2391-2999(-)